MRIEDRLTDEQKQLLRNLPAPETDEDREEVERVEEEADRRCVPGNQGRRERFGRNRKETDK